MTMPPPLVSLVREVQRRLNATHEVWRADDPDVAAERLYDVLGRTVPEGATLWGLFATTPELGGLRSPGVMADTIEGVVRDAIRQRVEPTLSDWMDAMLDSPPGDCVDDGEHDWIGVSEVSLPPGIAETVATDGYWEAGPTDNPDGLTRVQCFVKCRRCGVSWEDR